MLNDAKDRTKWKARWLGWCENLKEDLSRPVCKPMT